MIHIYDKKNCCGCSACFSVCPKHCISMQEDNEGFLYPLTDIDKCIDCHLCEQVCPCINQMEPSNPIECYAAKNNDDVIRVLSSSGGIFSVLSERVISEGGIVFGAAFDNEWKVVHTFAEKVEEISVFRGSKYVQSYLGDTFNLIKTVLKSSRKVLFSGTPCQIAGLKHFLRKEYDNLLTVEIVCHGVPSPKIWREYLSLLQLKSIGAISYKDKSTGWRTSSFTIKDTNQKVVFSEKVKNNKYMMAFIRNFTLRPTCFSCPAKAGKSHADITLADFWGIDHFMPELNDNKGISFVCVNTPKGEALMRNLNIMKKMADYQEAIPYNSCIFKSTIEPPERQRFWDDYGKYGIKVLMSLKNPSIVERIIKRLLG